MHKIGETKYCTPHEPVSIYDTLEVHSEDKEVILFRYFDEVSEWRIFHISDDVEVDEELRDLMSTVNELYANAN